MVLDGYYPKVAVGFPAFDPGNINKPWTCSFRIEGFEVIYVVVIAKAPR
jgi:hypothetical protein